MLDFVGFRPNLNIGLLKTVPVFALYPLAVLVPEAKQYYPKHERVKREHL